LRRRRGRDWFIVGRVNFLVQANRRLHIRYSFLSDVLVLGFSLLESSHDFLEFVQVFLSRGPELCAVQGPDLFLRAQAQTSIARDPIVVLALRSHDRALLIRWRLYTALSVLSSLLSEERDPLARLVVSSIWRALSELGALQVVLVLIRGDRVDGAHTRRYITLGPHIFRQEVVHLDVFGRAQQSFWYTGLSAHHRLSR